MEQTQQTAETYRYRVSHKAEYLFHVWHTTSELALEAAQNHARYGSPYWRYVDELTLELDPA